MRVFVHFKQQKLTELIEELTRIHSLYVQSSYALESKLMALIGDAQGFYKQIGESKSELKIAEINTYLDTVKRGIHPVTLEAVKTGRRTLLRGAHYSCLSKLSDQINGSIAQIDFQLNEAAETINNVILSILQAEMMTVDQLAAFVGIENAKVLWEKLKEDKQIALIDKKLKLSLIEQDILLLLDSTLNKLI